uniref:(northern house mosquito) hypothetical protein n=2 Tax=Culex pipiens TaxID=7175 RepID=A0A8D8DD95_CULPI
MPQLVRPDQGARLGRGQRSQVEAAAEADARVGRLPGADNHRGADAVGRDGRVVQPGEANRQISGIGRNPAAHFGGDQGRGEGGAVPRAVHLPARERVPLSLRGELRGGQPAADQGRRRLEDLLRGEPGGDRGRVRDAVRHREHLPSDDALPLPLDQVPVRGRAGRDEYLTSEH